MRNRQEKKMQVNIFNKTNKSTFLLSWSISNKSEIFVSDKRMCDQMKKKTTNLIIQNELKMTANYG